MYIRTYTIQFHARAYESVLYAVRLVAARGEGATEPTIINRSVDGNTPTEIDGPWGWMDARRVGVGAWVGTLNIQVVDRILSVHVVSYAVSLA